MEEKKQKPPESKEAIIAKLEALSHEPGFLYTLAMILRKEMFIDPEKLTEPLDREKTLIIQEITFLGGLMLKKPISLDMPSAADMARQLNTTYELFMELHRAHFSAFAEKAFKEKPPEKPMSEEEAEKSFREIFGSGEFIAEPIFYGSIGAYDFQLGEFARRRYSLDADWLREHKGLSIEMLVGIAEQLKDKAEQKVRNSKRPKSHEDMCADLLSIFTFRMDDLTSVSKEDKEAFVRSFVSIPGSVNQALTKPGLYNSLVSHPIIDLGDGRYFNPIDFNFFQSIYESPAYWMVRDDDYRGHYSGHQGDAAEDLVFEMLKGVFGEKNVFKRVIIRKQKGLDNTDIDVLVVLGNKAIIVQVKSKKLTELSKTGDEAKLREDFQKAIQESYDQALIARKAILDKSMTLFHEGKELKLEEGIDDAYIVCVTLENYPALISQIEVYLKKSGNDPHAIALSIFDLDILTSYLKDPFEFLYYLRQRIKYWKYFKADNEIALLAFHLMHKLYPRNAPDGGKVDMETLDGQWASYVDANFLVLKGKQKATKASEKIFRKWKRKEFDDLVARIRAIGNPGFTDAIFYLYDLAGDGADKLIKAMQMTVMKGLSDGKQHDFNMIFDAEGEPTGVSFMYFPEYSEKLISQLRPFAMAKKYQMKANMWLALATIRGGSDIVDIVGFSKEPWHEDAELEALTKIALKKGTPINFTTATKWPEKRPEADTPRNAKCPCGSGRKYKNCCGK